MTQLLATESTVEVPAGAGEHARRWYRLQEEHHFRVEQLAALEDETSPTPRHESVQRELRAAASTALAEIDAALSRIAAGTYGRCVRCERDIPGERLEVLPMTALCMACHFLAQNGGSSAT